MSEADIETVKRSYEDFNRGDLEGWLGWFSPGRDLADGSRGPRRRAAQGIDEIRRCAEGWIEAYEDLR